MDIRSVGHRFVVWGNRNPFTMAIIFDLIIVVAFAWALQVQNHHHIDQAKAEVAAEAKARDLRIAAANKEVCVHAVTAVTDQLNADLLKVVKGVEARYTESGRAVPAVYLQLELLITNRQPPLAACEPKESP